MTACPWCGTRHDSLGSNCQTCGGVIAGPAGAAANEEDAGTRAVETVPPPAPRPFAGNYAWRLLLTDGWAITAVVVGILGVTFVLLAAAMALAVTTREFALWFGPFGLFFVGASAPLIIWRWLQAEMRVEVLRSGVVGEGKIVQTRQIKAVRVNRRHPWAIEYTFQVKGQAYTGQLRTFNTPGNQHQAGRPIAVLYLPGAPEWNALFPHP